GPGDVHLQRKGAAAERADGVGDVAAGAGVSEAEREVGAGADEGERHRASDPARGAGHERDAARDVEGGGGVGGGRRRRRSRWSKWSRWFTHAGTLTDPDHARGF